MSKTFGVSTPVSDIKAWKEASLLQISSNLLVANRDADGHNEGLRPISEQKYEDRVYQLNRLAEMAKGLDEL